MPFEEHAASNLDLDRSEMHVERGLNFFERDADLIGEVEQLRRTKHLPEQLIERYVREALKHTTVRHLENGAFFAEIDGFDGVWASDEDLAVCGTQLREVLMDWLILKIEHGDRDIPVVHDINLNVL